MGPFITSLLSISRLRADLVTAGIDPGRAPSSTAVGPKAPRFFS
jgi:hypothetical protein